jgi:phosphoribosylaminoimidazolecarboxamide formyltransferase/IMP cyclohydrolase
MPTALVSVSDKRGIEELGKGLAALGWRIVASGGTARRLREAGVKAIEVSDYTGSPEMLGGRVKTLHPAIHGGILARPGDEAELASFGYGPIDLVVVNLYPFEETAARPDATEAEIIEEIDIGGVALIRAAAKNHARVTLLCDPEDYGDALDELGREGAICAATRLGLASKGFALTAAYDAAIASSLSSGSSLAVLGKLWSRLRYGENPHQEAAFYTASPRTPSCSPSRGQRGRGPLGGLVLQGKELSYNNILDLDAAWRAACSYERLSVCIVKHRSPCGLASADGAAEAFEAALACDPVSAYGGVAAFNAPVDASAARAMSALFLECVAAPSFDEEALALLGAKKNLRLVEADPASARIAREIRSVAGGFLAQTQDRGDPESTAWRIASKRQPTAEEEAGLRFAWKACAHVTSNAIVLARGESAVGIGGGQPNRVDAVRIALSRAGERSRGAVMASDAFFPFPDGIEAAAAAGVTAVVHPGGSIRDADSLAAADAAGMAMMLTGVRHFRH